MVTEHCMHPGDEATSLCTNFYMSQLNELVSNTISAYI